MRDEHKHNDGPHGLLGLFRRSARLMQRAAHGQGHVHHGQARILGLLMDNEPVGQRELMDMVGVRSASLSEILVKLEGHGLIVRERSESDRRNHIIRVTEDGRQKAAELRQQHEAHAQALFNGLDEEEKIRLAALLQKVVASLEAQCADLPEDGCHGRRHREGHGERHGRRHGQEHGRHGHGRGGRRGHDDRGRGGPDAAPAGEEE